MFQANRTHAIDQYDSASSFKEAALRGFEEHAGVKKLRRAAAAWFQMLRRPLTLVAPLLTAIVLGATVQQASASMIVAEPVNLRPDNARDLCLEFSPTAKLANCRGSDQQRILLTKRNDNKNIMKLGEQCIEGIVEGEHLFLAPCRQLDTQVWTYSSSGQIRNGNGLCVDVYRGQITPGTPVISYRCTGHVNQRWSRNQPMPRGGNRNVVDAAVIPQIATTKCLDMTSDNRLVLWNCHGGKNQKFTFRIGESGTISVDGRCLAAPNQGNGPVRGERCNGAAANQRWAAREDGAFRNAATGGCLDVKEGRIADGTEILSFTCQNSSNQRFGVKH